MVGPRSRREDGNQAPSVGPVLFDRRPLPPRSGDGGGNESSTNELPRARPRLREREGWIDELRASFGGLTRTGTMVIEGEPGMGKTALVNTACRLARDANIAVLSARGSQPETSFSFGVVRQLFEPFLSTLDSFEKTECLTEPARLVFARPGEQPGIGEPAFSGILDGLRSTLQNLAAKNPVVIAIDDLHWCDQESALWIEYMSRRLEHGRLWLVASILPRTQGPVRAAVDRIIAEPTTRTFSLEPLSFASVSELVGEYTGSDLPEAIQDCYFATRGNPFLLFALLNWLSATGFDVQADISHEIKKAVPPAVVRSILTRIRARPIASYPLLQAAAVLQGEAGIRETSVLAGIGVEAANQAADALAEANILARDRPLRYVYPLEQAAIYGDMGPASRATAHSDAARLLDAQGARPEVVAHHLLLTDPAGDEWHADRLVRAARVADDSGQHQIARKYLFRALAESPSAALRGEILLELALSDAVIGSTDALRRLREAKDLGVEPVGYAHAALRIVKELAESAAPADVLDALKGAATTVDRQDTNLRLRLELAIGHLDQALPSLDRTTAAVETVLAGRLMGRNRQERLSIAYVSLSHALGSEHLDSAQLADMVQQSIEGEELEVDDPVAVDAIIRGLETAVFAGRFDMADRIARIGKAASQRAEIAWAEAAFLSVLAHCSLQRGNLQEAEAQATRARSLIVEDRWPSLQRASTILAATAIEQGRLIDASDILEAFGNTKTKAESLEDILAIECRGKLRNAEGLPQAALDDFLAVSHIAEEWRVRNPAITSWRAGAARAFHACGDTRKALELATENLTWARNFGAPVHVGAALRVVAQVVEPTGRLALLDEAVNVLEPTGALLELAHATLELGTTLREAGRDLSARAALRQAADLALRCQATPLIERSVRELRASGARPRRLALSGADSLTPSERRVAELAAAGNKNSRIAEALFVSEKTVEGHLSRAYQKLGIQSREQLRALSVSTEPEQPAGARHSA